MHRFVADICGQQIPTNRMLVSRNARSGNFHDIPGRCSGLRYLGNKQARLQSDYLHRKHIRGLLAIEDGCSYRTFRGQCYGGKVSKRCVVHLLALPPDLLPGTNFSVAKTTFRQVSQVELYYTTGNSELHYRFASKFSYSLSHSS